VDFLGLGSLPRLASDNFVAAASAAARRVSDDRALGVPPATSRAGTLIVLVLVAGVTLRLVFAALIPLFPDEAYYWEWSRHLAGGYFDHPPGIPILIRAGTALAGATSFGVRLLAILVGLLAALATTGIAWQIAGGRAAFRAALVITCMPLAAAGLVLATPDTPLLATSALSIYALVRALQSPVRSRASLGWWCLTGVALGLAFCSKYTSVLLPIGVAIAVVWRPTLRSRFGEPGPYAACLIATLIFLPVLRWNAAHQWVSFGFQIHHGLASPARPDVFAPLKRMGDLLGGQAGLVSPVLFVLLALATTQALRGRSSDVEFVLGVTAVFTFLFFCYSATRQRVEPNWPAPAYIAAIPLLAAIPMSSPMKLWFRGGVWLAALLSVVIYLHAAFAILPLPPRKDPIARAAGWSELGAAVDDVRRRDTVAPSAGVWIAAERYQDASELAFHVPDHPRTFSLNFSSRSNQFDLWPGFPQLARPGDDLLLAVDDSRGEHSLVKMIAPYFRSYARDTLVDLRSSHGLVTQRRLWVMHGWTGGWPVH
jgi:dolichyl-phosphate-mannose-protein mannosyltransferase